MQASYFIPASSSANAKGALYVKYNNTLKFYKDKGWIDTPTRTPTRASGKTRSLKSSGSSEVVSSKSTISGTDSSRSDLSTSSTVKEFIFNI